MRHHAFPMDSLKARKQWLGSEIEARFRFSKPRMYFCLNSLMSRARRKKTARFDLEKYLYTAGIAKKVVSYLKGETIFSQGGPCDSVLYLQQGGVKLTITSPRGKEAVISLLYAGEFLGEGSIAGQNFRAATATHLPDFLYHDE